MSQLRKSSSAASHSFQWVSLARSSPSPPDCEQRVNNCVPIVSTAARSAPLHLRVHGQRRVHLSVPHQLRDDLCGHPVRVRRRGVGAPERQPARMGKPERRTRGEDRPPQDVIRTDGTIGNISGVSGLTEARLSAILSLRQRVPRRNFRAVDQAKSSLTSCVSSLTYPR